LCCQVQVEIIDNDEMGRAPSTAGTSVSRTSTGAGAAPLPPSVLPRRILRWLQSLQVRFHPTLSLTTFIVLLLLPSVCPVPIPANQQPLSGLRSRALTFWVAVQLSVSVGRVPRTELSNGYVVAEILQRFHVPEGFQVLVPPTACGRGWWCGDVGVGWPPQRLLGGGVVAWSRTALAMLRMCGCAHACGCT
jgi:hypothetical protein